MIIWTEISVDVSQQNEMQPIFVKQNDAYSRGYIITLTDNGEKITISNATVYLNVTNTVNPAKRASKGGTVNSDGTVSVILPSTVMEVAGLIQADVSVVTLETEGQDEVSSVLKSTLFYFYAQEAANPSGTSSTAEDDILSQLASGEITPPIPELTEYMKLSKDVTSAEIENLPQGQIFSSSGGNYQAIKTQGGYQEFVLGNRVSTIGDSPTNAQIPTALAVKNYADGAVANGRPIVATALLSYNLWNNNQQTIRGVSDLVTPNTQADVQIDQTAYEILKSNGVERIWVTNDGDSTNPTLTAHIIGDTPAESFAVQLTLTEVRAE